MKLARKVLLLISSRDILTSKKKAKEPLKMMKISMKSMRSSKKLVWIWPKMRNLCYAGNLLILFSKKTMHMFPISKKWKVKTKKIHLKKMMMKMADYLLKLEMISTSSIKRVGALRISAQDTESFLKERKQSSGLVINISFRYYQKLIHCWFTWQKKLKKNGKKSTAGKITVST